MNKSLTVSTLPSRSMSQPWVRGLMAASLVAGAWALSAGMSPAQARDVYWSVGVNSPGVQVGVSNGPPIYVQHPRPVYVQPAPVVVYPGYGNGYRSGYGYGYERPRYVAPPPVYYPQPARVVYIDRYGAPIGRGHGDRHWRGDDGRGHGHHDRGRGRGDDRYRD